MVPDQSPAAADAESGLVRNFDPVDVAANLASGVRWLFFSKPLERLFESETGARRSRQLLIQEIPALLLFEVLVLVDFSALPDVGWPAPALRLGLMNVVGLVVMWALARNPRPVVREGLAALVLVVQAAILLALVAMSDSVFRGHYHVGMLLVLMFGVMVQRVRFWYMVVASGLILAIFTTTGLLFSGLPPVEQQGTMSVMFVATLFSLMAGYTLEREARLTWLRSLNERLRSDRFEEMSSVDPLTGVGNRRALDRALAKLAEQRRDGPGVALAIADIDYFKAYNDSYGHVAGDDCLRRVAGLLIGEARKHGDTVFRYGGEEFVILLPSVDAGTAILVCERIRRAVEAAAIPHTAPSRNDKVTVSIGVATADAGEAIDRDALLFEADHQLYEAKSRGRNQVLPSPLHLARSRKRAG